MAAALQASPPRIVGRYVLYGEIASGGMATVHFGRLVGPAGFARPVAIKRLHAQFARDPDFVAMFLDEARLAARITHPNVVPTLDVVAAEDEVFLVMEYVRGAALGQLIRITRRRSDRIRPLVGLGIVSGMLQGLHAAHEATDARGQRLDLVHRDVSPQNVLVGTDGIPRLLDFGVAKAAGRLQTTRDGQLKGKLAYMAPEQVRGEPVTRQTDVYAASVVLWEVLTGRRLFYAENEATVLSRVLSAEVPAPSTIVPELPRALDRVVLRGLERDPAKRYSTAREMASELDAAMGVGLPAEIGEWVERTAADELRERAAAFAAIERAEAEAVDVPQFTSTSVRGAADAVSRGVPPERASHPWLQETRHEGARVSVASDVSQVSVAPGTEPTRRSSRTLVSMGASAGAIAAALLFMAVAVRRRDAVTPHRVPPAAPIAVAAPAPPAAPAHAATVEPTPAATAAAIPPATAEPSLAATVEPTPAEATEAPVASRAPATTGVAAAPAHPPTARSAPPGPSARADCNPPYTADAKGHIHFKLNCL